MLEDEILDHYDDLMIPYYSSREYTCSQKAIDLKVESLKQTLSVAQRANLNELLTMLSNDYARTASVAFITGIRNGSKVLNEIEG